MLRKAYLFLLITFFAISLQAAPKQVKAFFSFGIYSTKAGSPYVEVYLKIPVETLNYIKTKDDKFIAAANARLFLLRNDTVIYKTSYTLKTSPQPDTNNNASLLDIKRFELPNGLYDLILLVNDEADTLSTANIDIPIQISVEKNKLQMADILFCDTLYPVTQPDAFTRYGFNFIPSVNNMIDGSKKSLLFYTEMYNTLAHFGKGDFKYMVSVRNSKGDVVPGTEKIRSKKSDVLNYLFDGVDISKIPGGEYYLQVAILNKENKTVARRDKYFVKLTDSFMVAISALNASATGIKGVTNQEIKDFIEYLEPIASVQDIDRLNIAKRKDSNALQDWFYEFWAERNPENPQKAYTDYLAAITEVEAQFGTMLNKGFRTDRGRIYLKYGKPGTTTPYMDEPNAYPYEIWHYYKTQTRNNVRFIFYNPTQIHNDYILLHSEMPSERQNPNWKRMIYRRIDKSKSVDDNNSPNNFGDDLEKRMRE